jgi:hypothetical protein
MNSPSLCTYPHSGSFKRILNGDTAFYKQPNYLAVTQQDFAQDKLLPVNYTWNTESRIRSFAQQLFSIIFFPVGIHKLLHALSGKVILPASSPRLTGRLGNHANNSRSNISLADEWKYKRITVAVDGSHIDAMIVGTASTLNNGRWTLTSNGNSEFYEDKLSCRPDFKRFLSAVKSNAIVFNYPGVGASPGLPNRQAMAKAYRAMLNLLEDPNNGVGAQEIIGYGHSIGGGVQGDALQSHDLKPNVKYVFVKSRTFANLSTATESIFKSKSLGFLVQMLGWNIDPVKSSKTLQAPEIIMQTARVSGYQELVDSSRIIDDGVIPARTSLATALLEDNQCPKQNKVFIGMQEQHNQALTDPSFLANKIDTLLQL